MNEQRLKLGNHKLKGILIFDLPTDLTCLNSKDCRSRCYARKAERLYPAVLPWRMENYKLAKDTPEQLKELLISQLKRAKEGVIRIHSSGDFFSQEYVELWRSIIKELPDKRFYAYTKSEGLLDFTPLAALSNFNLIPSYIDGLLNFGSKEYCEDLVKNHGAYLCPATTDKGIKCGRDCSFCVENNRVCFKKH